METDNKNNILIRRKKVPVGNRYIGCVIVTWQNRTQTGFNIA